LNLDAVALGEILIDMIPLEIGNYTKVKAFSMNFGGAPFNYAIALSRLGRKVGAICAVGDDPFGNFLITTLRKEGIDTTHILIKKARTSLAFVVRHPEGERSFFFYRKPWVNTADTEIESKDIDLNYVGTAKILHVSGVILSHEPARSSVLKTMESVRKLGVKTSFDVNLRLDIWESRSELNRVYEQAFNNSDILLISHDEARDLLNLDDPSKISEYFIEKYNPEIVAVKLGAKGSYVRYRNGLEIFKEAFKVRVIDTNGAGDAWAAGFELGMLENREPEESIVIANAVGALTVTKIGAITALPTREELKNFLNKKGINIKL